MIEVAQLAVVVNTVPLVPVVELTLTWVTKCPMYVQMWHFDG